MLVLFNMLIREGKSTAIVTISVRILMQPSSEAHIFKAVLCLRRSRKKHDAYLVLHSSQYHIKDVYVCSIINA